MPEIIITTIINAPIERCFDLSRSIDLHKTSTSNTNEEAVAGKTEGLIELGESVTWEATHFGLRQSLTSKITKMDRPSYFVDEMVQGAFRSFRHEHRFKEQEGRTIMIDHFSYRSPLGLLGVLADKLFLEQYMRNFLEERNMVIKQYAETDLWMEVLTK